MKQILLVLIVFFILFSISIVFLFSLYTNYRYPLLTPTNFTLHYWKHMIMESNLFITGLKNSVLLGLINGIISSVTALLFARAITRHEFHGKALIKKIYSLPLFIPAISLYIGVHLMMIKLSLVNGIAGVVISHLIVSVPYSTSVLYSFSSGINPDMENAAKTLGASDAHILFKLYIPLISPALSLSFSIGFLISFSEYLSTFLVGGGKIITFSTVMYPLIENGDRGNSAVLGFSFILINLLAFFITELFARKLSGKDHYLYET